MSSESDNLIRRDAPQFVMSDICSMAPDLTGACGNEEMTDRQTDRHLDRKLGSVGLVSQQEKANIRGA